MQGKLFVIVALVALCAISAHADVKGASAAGVEAQVDSTLPWEVRVSKTGGIAAGRYLKLQYTFLGERDSARAAVPDAPGAPGAPIPFFHSVPISNPALASYITTETNATPDVAYVGFGSVNVPQSATGAQFDGFVVNLLALRDFNVDSYTLPINGGQTKVCFAGLQADNITCVPHSVTAGTLKMNVAVNRWTWAAAGAYWRVSFAIRPVGFTAANVTHDESPQDHVRVTYTDTDGFEMILKVNKKYNRGDNRLVFGTAFYTQTGTNVDVDIDVARSALVSNGAAWFLYDPEVTLSARTGPGQSAASHIGVSVFALIAAFVAIVANLF
jgi:hypothetical protein